MMCVYVFARACDCDEWSWSIERWGSVHWYFCGLRWALGGEQCSLQASAAGKNLGEWALKILISLRNSHDFVGFCKQSFFMTRCQQILTNQTRRFPEPRNTQLIQVTRGHRYIFDTCVCEVRVCECMRAWLWLCARDCDCVCVSVGESRVIVRCEHV